MFDHQDQEAHRIYHARKFVDSVQKRLETFKRWPVVSPVKPHELAAAGFRSSGLDDEVVCFKCDLNLQLWKTGEDPWNEHKKCRPRCPFVLECERRRPFVLECESENGSEVHDSPAGTANSSKAQDPGHAVKESLSEGTELRRSVSHNTGLPQGGSRSATYMQYQGRSHSEEQIKYKKTKHETSAPNQPSFPQKTPETFYEPYATEKMVSNEDGLVQENCYRPQQRYPGTKSKMRETNPYPPPRKASRWQGPGRNDPPGRNVQGTRRPTPFAAFPVRDLHNWDPTDTAWGEHQKWKPQCPLVLEHFSGPLSEREEHAPRQRATSQERFTTPQAAFPYQRPQQTHGLNDRQVPIMSGDPAVHGTWGRSQSFPVAEVSNVVRPQTLPLDQQQPHWQTQPVTTSQAGHMTSALQSGSSGGELGSSQRNQDLQERNCVSAVTSPTTSVPDVSSLRQSLSAPMPRSSESGEESLEEKLERMQEEHMCKICMDAELSVVFRPCGHLSCCANCANGMDFCPMCRVPIQEKIRIFLS